MAKYKAYPEYKDSGVEWISEIPKQWKVTRLKLVTSMNMGQSPNSEDCNTDGVGLAFLQGNAEFGKVNPKEKQYCLIPRKIANPGELLFSVRAPVGAINFADKKYGIGRGLCSITASVTTKNSFLWWLLATCKYQLDAIATGSTFEAVSAEQLGNLNLALPSISEQMHIAAFLDHETAKIDKLIEKQQQLIELLKEKRQAVISHAVTKGLNPNVPMKDSGVEWLGEVPEHWGITRLKYECRNIVDCPHSTPNYTVEGEYPAIRTADISAGYLDLGNCRRVTESVYDERNFRLIPKAGDIIYSREGERFGIGAPIPEGAKVCLAQRVMLFRAKSTPGYLMWALNSSSTYTQAQQDCIGSTSPHVNVDTIKNFILAWPPENEREVISNFINQTLDSVESLTIHLTEKLTLLQERRSALISAAVTGKIDVRDWVAPNASDIEVSQEVTA